MGLLLTLRERIITEILGCIGDAMKAEDRELLKLKAEVFQAVGQPIRLAIVQLLSEGEMCVCEIAEKVGAKRSNVSRHLAVMLRAGVLGVRKDGLKMIYELRTPCVLDVVSCVTEVVRRKIEGSAAMLGRL